VVPVPTGGSPMKRRVVRSWGPATVLVVAFTAAPAPSGSDVLKTGHTRPAALAGSWYPSGRASLLSAAHFLMRAAAGAPTPTARPIALVVPHAGWDYSGIAAATAFRLLHRGDFERVVVLAPSHHGRFRGYALDDATAYRTPLGEVPVCAEAMSALASDVARFVSGVTEPEHAVEIELPFLQASLGSFSLVPILVGDTDADIQAAFAERLAALDDGRTLYVFSSDFTHYGPRYGFSPFGALSPETRERIRTMNERAIALLSSGDTKGFRAYLRETGNTICGRHGLATMLELLSRIAPRAGGTLLAHYASADVPGLEDTSSVTYVSLAFARPGEPATNRVASGAGTPLVAIPRLPMVTADAPPIDPALGDRLVHLARAALRSQLAGGDDLDKALREWPRGAEYERLQGVFVTLSRTDPDEIRRYGRLRGCIGQPEPRFPLYYGTVQAALDAALGDPRFDPVTASELERLAVEVTVLSRQRPVGSWRDIEIGTDGIVLQKGDRAALFLPQVAAQNGWSIEETLTALSRKAGLPPDGWKEGASFSVFTGQVFEEKP
jgi:AmmeMemoRadiSam system protein B/AmmeMemoRadiSam system protein A